MKRLEPLNERAHHAGRREELAGEFPLLLRKARKAVFIGSPEDVFLRPVIHHVTVGKEIDHIAEPPLVQLGPCEVLRQNILQPAVRLLDGAHGVVDRRADFLGVRCIRDVLPARILRHEKHALGGVFVDVLLKAFAFVDKLAKTRFKTVGDIF